MSVREAITVWSGYVAPVRRWDKNKFYSQDMPHLIILRSKPESDTSVTTHLHGHGSYQILLQKKRTTGNWTFPGGKRSDSIKKFMNSSENIFLKDKINRYIAVKGFIKTCGYGEGYDKRDITLPGVKPLDSKYSEAHPVQFNDCSIPANLMSVFISSRGIPVGIEKYNVKSAYVLMVKDPRVAFYEPKELHSPCMKHEVQTTWTKNPNCKNGHIWVDAERILRFPNSPVDKSSKKLCVLNDMATIAEIRKAIESIRHPAPQIFKFVRQLAITPTSSPVASPVSSPVPTPQKSTTGLAVSKRRSVCYDAMDLSALLAGFQADKYINSSNYQEIWSDGTYRLFIKVNIHPDSHVGRELLSRLSEMDIYVNSEFHIPLIDIRIPGRYVPCIKELITSGAFMTHVVDAYVRNLERIRLSSTEGHHRIMGGNYFTREYGDEKENVKYELKYSMFRDSICTYLRNKILEYVNVIPLHSKALDKDAHYSDSKAGKKIHFKQFYVLDKAAHALHDLYAYDEFYLHWKPRVTIFKLDETQIAEANKAKTTWERIMGSKITHEILASNNTYASRKKQVVKEAIKYLGLWPHTCDCSVNHNGTHKLQSGGIKSITLSLKGPGINEPIRSIYDFC